MSVKNFFIIIIILILNLKIFSQDISGIFFCPNVGAKFPIGTMSERLSTGYSFGAQLEYGNSSLPIFLKTDFKYYFFPQNKLVAGEYNQQYVYSFGIGFNYFLQPIFSKDFIAISYLGLDLRFNMIDKSLSSFEQQLKQGSVSEKSVGFGASFGLSIFFIDLIINYYLLKNDSVIGIEYSLRLPIYISY